MDKSKSKKLLIAVGILIAVAVAFILVESEVFKSNVKKADADSTTVQQIK